MAQYISYKLSLPIFLSVIDNTKIQRKSSEWAARSDIVKKNVLHEPIDI